MIDLTNGFLDQPGIGSGQMPRPAMHARYGPLLRAFFARYFGPIAFPEAAAERIRSLAARGTVVYVAPAADLLHFLYLNHAGLKFELPLARFTNGVSSVLFQPVDELWDRLLHLGDEDELDPEEEDWIRERRQFEATLRAGQAALLFLDLPATILNPHQSSERHLLETLIRVQRETARPIYLVPNLIQWDLNPPREGKGVADAIFGGAEGPGFLRSTARFLRHRKKALVKVAEPIDLQAELGAAPDAAPAEFARTLEARLRKELFLEVFDVTGPRLRAHEEYLDEILRDPVIEDFIQTEAQGDLVRVEALRRQAQNQLDEIAAEPRIRWPLALNWVLNVFWKRMYEGFVVDEAGFDRIRAAIRKGPVILCPSHKSHVDYLVLSQLCLHYRVPLPHIAAGENLSFWPMGPIFRHSGAFFLRRSFKGDRLYPIVFRTYLRYVMREGFPIEFFIEGTRSRTGKLLGPRYGILSWLFQAFLESTGEDLQIVPISIDYEKIVEGRSYLRELAGGEKKKEDVGALLKSRKVLRSKFGKIYVQIGEALSVRQVLEANGHQIRDLSEDSRRFTVQKIAHKILFEINRVATVTPSAMVAFCLLNHRRRGIAHALLLERARWLRGWLMRRDARFSATLGDFDRALENSLDRFANDGVVSVRDLGDGPVYALVERRRLALDYYRNNVLHHFVPAAITAQALESFTVDAVPYEALSQRVRTLSQLFKHEFLFRSERHFDEELRKVLAELALEGVVREEEGFVVKVAETEGLRHMVRGSLDHFVECYWLVARTLGQLHRGPLYEREFYTRTLRQGELLFAQGELLFHESLSREIMKNAIATFTENGLCTTREGRKGKILELTDLGRTQGRLEAEVSEIATFLHRD